jgi:hypothetical protein
MWGATLGVVAGIIAGPVLNLPLRLGGLSGIRWMPLVVGPIFYYFLWLPVGVVYHSLQVMGRPADTAGGSTER